MEGGSMLEKSIAGGGKRRGVLEDIMVWWQLFVLDAVVLHGLAAANVVKFELETGGTRRIGERSRLGQPNTDIAQNTVHILVWNGCTSSTHARTADRMRKRKRNLKSASRSDRKGLSNVNLRQCRNAGRTRRPEYMQTTGCRGPVARGPRHRGCALHNAKAGNNLRREVFSLPGGLHQQRRVSQNRVRAPSQKPAQKIPKRRKKRKAQRTRKEDRRKEENADASPIGAKVRFAKHIPLERRNLSA
ncbi:hypothetical protein B0H16DRAFT_1468849 [Mycena metata]|uniref:Uncharacterized protein n=1 Tax=Mycena metata TaxID=1033252 RepID=A0AAD7MV10_9AGAR|nr:hypothetical protein B0H16DRAFT_1468849 [Mycena metata]